MKMYSFKKSGCLSFLHTSKQLLCFVLFLRANKSIHTEIIIIITIAVTASIYLVGAYFVPGNTLRTYH